MKTRALLILAAFFAASLFASGCGAEDSSSSTGQTPPPVTSPCDRCGAPASQGKLKNLNLAETSGIAASSTHDDVYYAHNDSGDSSRFFALSRIGTDLGTYNVDSAQNDDWEDIARGPCLQGSCLFIADTGDNLLNRASYAIYRIAEPASIGPGEHNVPSEKLVFTYADGPHDAETLLVHPITGVLTIITKVDVGPASIYELPLPLTVGKTFTATKVGEVAPAEGDPRFTGGSVHPDATGIVLRTHTNLFYYSMKPEQTAAEALAGSSCTLQVADEKQGEAVTWLASGDGILTVGEGAGTKVSVSTCQPP